MAALVTKYDTGDLVYLITDADQLKRFVVAVCKVPGSIKYELACGTDTSWHYDFEISDTQDVVTKTDN